MVILNKVVDSKKHDVNQGVKLPFVFPLEPVADCSKLELGYGNLNIKAFSFFTDSCRQKLTNLCSSVVELQSISGLRSIRRVFAKDTHTHTICYWSCLVFQFLHFGGCIILNHLCFFSPDTIFTSLGFSQVLFEASHPHDLEVMVSGASATWLGGHWCWLLVVGMDVCVASWWLKRDNPDSRENTHTRRHMYKYYRKRESFLDGTNHFTTDWMFSSYRHFLYNDGTSHRDGPGWFLFSRQLNGVNSIESTLVESVLGAQIFNRKYLGSCVLCFVFFCWSCILCSDLARN